MTTGIKLKNFKVLLNLKIKLTSTLFTYVVLKILKLKSFKSKFYHFSTNKELKSVNLKTENISILTKKKIHGFGQTFKIYDKNLHNSGFRINP